MFANGLILVRDIIVAYCFVRICNCILEWRLTTAIAPVIFLAILRPAAIAELLIMIWFMLLVTDHLSLKGKTVRHITFWALVIIGGAIVIVNNLSTLSRYAMQISGGVRTFVLGSDSSSDSTLHVFYELPLLLRIPLMSFYYFIMPTFSVKAFSNYGYFSIRDGYYALFGLMNLFLLPRFINSFSYSFFRSEEKRMKYITLLFILMMVFISQLSTVTRHKTGFIFLYYVACVYGKDHYTRNSKYFGWICSCVLALFYITKFIAA